MLLRYTDALAIVLATLFFLDLPVYLNLTVLKGIQPKHFYFVMTAAALPVFLARSTAAVRWLGSPFGIWMLALAGLNVAHLLGTLDPLAPDIISTRAQTLVLMLMLTFVLSQARPQVLHAALPWIAIVVAAVVLVDFLAPEKILPRPLPDDLPTGMPHEIFARASGTLNNPNKAGEALVLLLMLSMPIARRGLGWIVIGLVCAAVAATVSRSAIAVLVLVLAAGFVLGSLPRLPMLLLAGVVVLLVAVPTVLIDYLSSRTEFGFGNMENLLGRLGSLTGGDFSDSSSAERFLVLSQGLSMFVENPFTGAGAAATDLWNLPVSVHNQAVLMLAEYGIIGGVLWLCMLLLPFARIVRGEAGLPQALLACLVLLVFSMATHNMLDFNYWLASIALIALGWPRIGTGSEAARPPRSGTAGLTPRRRGRTVPPSAPSRRRR